MSKPSITNCPNTFFKKVHSFNCIFSSLCCFACVQIRHTPLSGGYCGEVPPLPIPNREVKLTCADGTAMQCGRVGSRLLLSRASDFERFLRLFCFHADCFFYHADFADDADSFLMLFLFPTDFTDDTDFRPVRSWISQIFCIFAFAKIKINYESIYKDYCSPTQIT